MPKLDEAYVEIQGHTLRSWTRYRIDSDLRTPADSFDLEIAIGSLGDRAGPDDRRRIRELTAEGSPIKVFVGGPDSDTGALQLTGIVDEQVITDSPEGGTTIRISGRDRAAHLVDSSAPITQVVAANTTFIEMVRDLVAPWGIEVVSEAATNRTLLTGQTRRLRGAQLAAGVARQLGVPVDSYSRAAQRRAAAAGVPVDEFVGASAPSAASRRITANSLAPGDVERLRVLEAKPQPGETVWGVIDRHARRLGILAWMSADGKLILSSPTWEQPPLYRFVRRFVSAANDPNNLLAGSEVRRSAADRFSGATVYGWTPSRDAARTRFVGRYENEAFPYFKPLIVQDTGVRSKDEADKRAQRELELREMNALVLSYNLSAHGQGNYFAIDTIATVVDEVGGVSGDFHVVKRTFTKDRNGGTRTRVEMIPKGAFRL